MGEERTLILRMGKTDSLEKGNRIAGQSSFIIVCIGLSNLQNTIFMSNVYSFIQ